MIASSVMPTRYVFVPLKVNGLGLLATTRTIPGLTGAGSPYAKFMVVLNDSSCDIGVRRLLKRPTLVAPGRAAKAAPGRLLISRRRFVDQGLSW